MRDLEQLVLKSLSFKQGKVSQGDYYVYLQEVAQRYGVDPEPYKSLITYTEYITLYESIDLLSIFDEARDFEDQIKEKLFKNDDQRRLYALSKCVGFVKDLFELKLMNGDFAYLSENVKTCNAQALAGFAGGVEWIEGASGATLVHTDAVIHDFQVDLVGAACASDGDGANAAIAGRADRLAGIGQQIDQHHRHLVD